MKIILYISVFILFSLVTVLFLYPFSINLSSTLVADDSYYTTWAIAWNHHQFFRAPLKLFQANIFYPSKGVLAYSENMIGFLPISIIFYLFIDNPVLVHNLICFFTFPMGGMAMFALVYLLVEDHIVAFLAGLIFSFCNYRFIHMDHLQILASFWLPLVFLGMHRTFLNGDKKWIAVFFIFFNLSWLSSMYIGIFLGTVLVPFLGCLVWKYGMENVLRNRVSLVLWCLITFLLAVFVGYSYYNVLKIEGYSRNINEIMYLSPNLEDFLRTSRSNFIWGNVMGETGRKECFLFPGLMVTIFFIIGFLPGRKTGGPQNIYKTPYLVITLLVGLFCLGPYLKFNGEVMPIKLPYWLLWKYVVFFKGIRVPQRFFAVFFMGMAVIAGFGLKNILDKIPENLSWSKVTMCVLLGMGIISENLNIPLNSIPVLTNGDIPQVYKWLSTIKDDPVVIELPLNFYSNPESSPQKKLLTPVKLDSIKIDDKPILKSKITPSKRMKKKSKGYRKIKANLSSPLPMYYSIYHWKRIVNGMSGFIPRHYLETQRIMEQFPSPKSIDRIEELKVNIVIIHAEYYGYKRSQLIINQLNNNPRFKLLHVYGNDYVYRFV